MRDRIYMGRIHHYLLYDENSWNQKKKVDLLFVFVCWIFLQLYYAVCFGGTACTDLLYEKGIDTKKNKSLDLVLSTFDYYIGDLKNPLNLFLQGLNSIFFPLALACIQAGFQENTIANNSLLLVLMIFTIISSICIAFFSVFYAIENKNRFVAVEIRDYLLDYILKVDYKNSKKRIKNHWKHYE